MPTAKHAYSREFMDLHRLYSRNFENYDMQYERVSAAVQVKTALRQCVIG